MWLRIFAKFISLNICTLFNFIKNVCFTISMKQVINYDLYFIKNLIYEYLNNCNTYKFMKSLNFLALLIIYPRFGHGFYLKSSINLRLM